MFRHGLLPVGSAFIITAFEWWVWWKEVAWAVGLQTRIRKHSKESALP